MPDKKVLAPQEVLMDGSKLTKAQLAARVAQLEARIRELENGSNSPLDPPAQPEGKADLPHDPTRQAQGGRTLEEHQGILSAVFNLIPHQMFVKDVQGRYLMVNSAFTERTGLTEEMVRGKTSEVLPLLDENSQRIYQAQDEEVLSSRERREYPRVRVRYTNNREVINRIVRMPLLGRDGEPVGLAGMVENITERVLAEEAVLRSEQVMARAQAVMHMGSMDWDLVNQRQYWSDEIFRIIGYEPQAFVPDDKRFADALHPEDKKRILEEIAAAFVERRAYAAETRVVRPDGEVRCVFAQGDITQNAEGKPVRMFGTVQDITEKKRAEEELRESEKRFRNLFEGSIQGILIHRRGKPLFVNQAYADMFGYDSQEELMALESIDDLLHPEDKALLVEFQKKRLQGEPVPTHYTFRAYRKDGSMIWLDSLATLVEWEGEFASQSVNIDITERKKAENALRESDERFRNIVDYSPSAILLKDMEGRYVLMNKQFESWYGWSGESALGKKTEELYAGKAGQQYIDMEDAVLKTGRVQEQEMEIPFADGTLHTVLVTKFPVIGRDGEMINIGTFNTDVSALRQAEQMLMQAQRLEALGSLAGGIAHDLNNILVPIMGYAQVLLRQYDQDDEAQGFLNIIADSSMRAKDLVSQILQFTRSSEGRRDICLLPPIVNEVVKLLQSSFPSQVKIHEKIAASVAPVTADPSQIHQVLMNLCINAAHAMPDGGDLSLELRNVHLEGLRTYLGDYLRGDYVLLACTDTGTGMAQETMGRIFEPFFTTRPKGQGTGLGLSTVFGIVRNHEGGIVVTSKIGEGTRFEIYLSAIDLNLEDHLSDPAEIPRGHESILFVDDEQAIADLAKVALENQGYQVISQTNSQAALALFEENPQGFDMIITDQTMPGMSGATLIEKIKAIRPEIPVILCTGFSEQITPDMARKIGVREYLYKPVDMEELWRLVRQTLDNPEPLGLSQS